MEYLDRRLTAQRQRLDYLGRTIGIAPAGAAPNGTAPAGAMPNGTAPGGSPYGSPPTVPPVSGLPGRPPSSPG
ncbi:hypothetical protein HA066_26210, partial [Escherichia coli]